MQPPWSSLAANWNSTPLPESSTVTLGPCTISLGHDDSEADDDKLMDRKVVGHDFGWDNEHPKRDDVRVEEFRIEWRPVTNGQFYEFYKTQGEKKVGLPASWVESGGSMMVCRFSFAST